MEILIVWILFAIVTCAIGTSKGRNGVAWLLIGFGLGIFGLIMVCAMPALNKEAR